MGNQNLNGDFSVVPSLDKGETVVGMVYWELTNRVYFATTNGVYTIDEDDSVSKLIITEES